MASSERSPQFSLDQNRGACVHWGTDEAGRGCWAGPVVVAAIAWTPDEVAQQPFYPQLNDSKKLTAGQREVLYPQIVSTALAVRVAWINNVLVDQLNVLRASLLGFERCLPDRYDPEALTWIDGPHRPVTRPWAAPVVGADRHSSAVAAASIVAKVLRDHWMMALSAVYPGFGFHRHKGYGSAEHLKALKQEGPTPFHRKSFRPVKEAFLQHPSEGKVGFDWKEGAFSPLGFREAEWWRFRNRYFHASLNEDTRLLLDMAARSGTPFPHAFVHLS